VRRSRTSVYLWFLTLGGFRRRTPGPPPFSSMNSTPAASSARRTAKSFAVVIEVSFSAPSRSLNCREPQGGLDRPNSPIRRNRRGRVRCSDLCQAYAGLITIGEFDAGCLKGALYHLVALRVAAGLSLKLMYG